MAVDDQTWEPEAEDEFSVEVDELCSLFGGCEKCPGRMTANVNGKRTTVLYEHWCHKAVDTV